MAGGGAWKVAYADFVTAMMALFMVLWISAQDKKILIATSKYFQNPFNSPMQDHSGVMPFNRDTQDSSSRDKDDENASGQQKPSDRNKQIDMSFLNSAAADFYRMLQIDQDLAAKLIDIQVTSDGLRITLFNRAQQPLFVNDGTELTTWGRHVLQSLAWLIDRHQFRVTVDGHTRAHLKFAREEYSTWELSADRANTARRALVHYAVAPGLIERVAGYGDTRPLADMSADDESNQRVTLSLTLGKRARTAAVATSPPAGSKS
ncbi:MAG: OmpA family protein [Opitutaceae bacterium]|nr:OmpA family protein [Opitutaceae bacterium]